MKNKNRGFIIPLLIVIIAALALAGGVYIYMQNSDISNNEPEPSIRDFNDTSTTTVSAHLSSSSTSTPALTVKSGRSKPDLVISSVELVPPLNGANPTGGSQRVSAIICDNSDFGVNSDNLSEKTNDLPKISVMFSINNAHDYYMAFPVFFPQKCDLGFSYVDINKSFGPFKGLTSGYYDITATVDRNLINSKLDNQIDESNESNNSLTKKIYLDFGSSVPNLSITSPLPGMVWKEGQSYNISWSSSNASIVTYRLTIGNFASNSSKGLENLGSDKHSYAFSISNGFVNSMFMGDNHGKTAADIENSFYIEVNGLDQNNKIIETGRSEVFTIQP